MLWAKERRERESERENRERVRLLCAGRVGGLNKMKRGALCWWLHEEAADRGSRRAAEFTPHLEKASSCLTRHLSLSPTSPAFSPSPLPLRFVRHLFHLLLLVFFFVFARLVNASRRPERTLHTQLFTSRLFGSSLPPRRRRPPFSPCHEKCRYF